MSLEQTDQESAAFAVAPRVTLDSMKEKIRAQYEFTASAAIVAMEMPAVPELDILSVCVLVMRNGFTVIGKSAPASAANFNADYGRKLAFEDAIRQLWPIEGYALREKLAT